MNLGSLVSETRNPQTMDLDALSTLELVNRFNQQDTLVAQAVKETLPEVAKAVDAAAEALRPAVALSTWERAPAGVLGFWMRQNVRPPLGCRTVWSLG
ncbi:N-acetylmuramic acid-6-phosphate etherase [Enterobacter asburiae]|nr:N-acetylmuramic acid-6-phosphate etherase [Enterobacter asburiae]